MDCERNVVNAENGKLLILFSLIAQEYLEMAIILNAKNVALLVIKNKEDDLWPKELFVHSAAGRRLKKNFS